jgi:hypothetical protein
MARITVDPGSFAMVDYDADAIGAVARQVAGELGVSGDEEIRIEVDETSPLARWTIGAWGEGDEPIVLQVDGGAFEDTRRPRQFDERRTADVVGRLLLRVLDRRTPAFAGAPAEDELTLAQGVAWDVYAVGRLVRMGHEGQRQRRLYQFRNRHGFSDATDEAFDQIWNASQLTWAELDAISAGAMARSVFEPDG